MTTITVTTITEIKALVDLLADLGIDALHLRADDRHHTADECRSEGEGAS